MSGITQGDFEKARRRTSVVRAGAVGESESMVLLVGSTEDDDFNYDLVLRPTSRAWVKGSFLDARGKPVGKPRFWRVQPSDQGTQKQSVGLGMGSAPRGSHSVAVAIVARDGLYHRVLPLRRSE